MDAEGHLAFLAASEWKLGRAMELFPEIVFHKTREYCQ
jgi:peptide chain release factor 3